MISITDNATKKLKEFVEPWEIVRLAVEGGGCNGFQYRFGVQPDDEVETDDHITKASDGVRLCIDPISYQYLENVEIDFEESSFSSAFKINNPDVKATCGCGSSFS
jgi:iron-sulfur cluster assembly accessory protein